MQTNPLSYGGTRIFIGRHLNQLLACVLLNIYSLFYLVAITWITDVLKAKLLNPFKMDRTGSMRCLVLNSKSSIINHKRNTICHQGLHIPVGFIYISISECRMCDWKSIFLVEDKRLLLKIAIEKRQPMRQGYKCTKIVIDDSRIVLMLNYKRRPERWSLQL